MAAETSPLKTWQVLNTARRMNGIGTQWLLRLLNIASERQLQRLCADPKTTESASPNLIDKYELLLSRLMELGREDVARAAVSRQAFIVGCELRCIEEARPDRDSIAEEMLDDHPPLVAFHQAVRAGADHVEVHRLYQHALREIEETYALYVRTTAGKAGGA